MFNKPVSTHEAVEPIRSRVVQVAGPLGRRVDVVVNYDQFEISGRVEREWAEMVSDLETRFYDQVSRYSSSAFVRRWLGHTLERRRRATIHNSENEAYETLHQPPLQNAP